MQHLYVDWAEYHRLIERLALSIHRSGWHFDSVIALARGGLRVGEPCSRASMSQPSYSSKGWWIQGLSSRLQTQ